MTDEEIGGYPMYFVAAIILAGLIAFIILLIITSKAINIPMFP